MGVKPTCAQPLGPDLTPLRGASTGARLTSFMAQLGVAVPSRWGDVAQLGEGAECGQDTENGLEAGNEHPQEGEEKP